MKLRYRIRRSLKFILPAIILFHSPTAMTELITLRALSTIKQILILFPSFSFMSPKVLIRLWNDHLELNLITYVTVDLTQLIQKYYIGWNSKRLRLLETRLAL